MPTGHAASRSPGGEKLFQFGALPIEIHHLRPNRDNPFAEYFVAAPHGVNMQPETDEEQSRDDTQDARTHQKLAVRLVWLGR